MSQVRIPHPVAQQHGGAEAHPDSVAGEGGGGAQEEDGVERDGGQEEEEDLHRGSREEELGGLLRRAGECKLFKISLFS